MVCGQVRVLLRTEPRQQEAGLAFRRLVEDRLEMGHGLAAGKDGLLEAHPVPALEV
jgi:hypothetical protein